MDTTTRDAVVERLADYPSVCEVGIGRRPAVARELAARGVRVTATDIHEQSVPDGVAFVRDDLLAARERARTAGDPGRPYHAAAVYALDCPPELHRPLAAVADAVGADALFTTLGADPPTVPVARTQLPDGETVFTVCGDG
ncbi:MAG: uncharacterized protein conserved in archaea [halophilic archaeon J07HB67]|nr:MAG: uncharacterized protein conserved in archaea [halophilic archaeon J07HB67]